MVSLLYLFYLTNRRSFDTFFLVVTSDLLNAFLGREGRNRTFDASATTLTGRLERFLSPFGTSRKVNDCTMIIMPTRPNILPNISFRCWIPALSACDHTKHSGTVPSLTNFCYRGHFARHITSSRRKIAPLILLLPLVSSFNCTIPG